MNYKYIVDPHELSHSLSFIRFFLLILISLHGIRAISELSQEEERYRTSLVSVLVDLHQIDWYSPISLITFKAIGYLPTDIFIPTNDLFSWVSYKEGILPAVHTITVWMAYSQTMLLPL